MKSCCAAMAVIILAWASVASAAPQASAPSLSAPTLVRVDGQVKTPTGDARTGSVTMVVSLYAEKDDTTPLWVEPQVITLDAAGRYTLFAGATLPDGVPQEFLFGSTPGRWLGVGVQGDAEQFRLMLVTVPYAAKAREADTLAGKSVTDFVLSDHFSDTVKAALKADLAKGASGTGPGTFFTAGALAKDDGGGSSIFSTAAFEVGGNVGIGTASPGALLDVNKATAGATAIFIRNPTGGTGNYARLDIKTDGAGGRGLFDAYSSTFTTSANSVQSGVSFTAIGAGGFSIALQDPAAPMRFYTGAGPSERFRIDSSGNVGIGTTAPAGRLHVNGDILMTTAPGNAVQFGTPNAETGMSIIRTNIGRADLRFDGSLLKLVAGAANSGPPPSSNGIAISTTGNVGVGPSGVFTNIKLAVDGGNQTAVYGLSNGAWGVFGRSIDGTGVEGQSSGGGAGLYGLSDAGPALAVRSNTGVLMEGYPNVSTFNRSFHINLNGTYVAGSDFAESLPTLGDKSNYEVGDVLVASTKAPGAVEKSRRPFDVRVAGVYSTRPGVLGAEKDGATRVDPGEVPVAIVGIVPTKVSAINGPIRVGDSLTTSSTPGYAMRCANRAKCVGAIVGKALEPLASDKGVIKALVMLQ